MCAPLIYACVSTFAVALFIYGTSAFTVVPALRSLTAPALRAAAPTAMMGSEMIPAALPTTDLLAADPLLLGAGGLIFACVRPFNRRHLCPFFYSEHIFCRPCQRRFIPLAVVAVVVINFGIMKKK